MNKLYAEGVDSWITSYNSVKLWRSKNTLRCEKCDKVRIRSNDESGPAGYRKISFDLLERKAVFLSLMVSTSS